jgi:hypothetical protein
MDEVGGLAWNIPFISRMTKGCLPISLRLSIPMLGVKESMDMNTFTEQLSTRQLSIASRRLAVWSGRSCYGKNI